MVNIYVGNLSYRATPEDLRRVYAAHGEVDRVVIARKGRSGKSRGFGFVEMRDPGEARAALRATQSFTLLGRAIKVAPAGPTLEGAHLMDVQDDFSDCAR
jgi:RNA recognition motif-containing protein